MATRQTRILAHAATAPSTLVLFLWMIVPLGMTIYFSLLRYSLLDPGNESFIGLLNYEYFLTDPAFFTALFNTLKLVGGVCAAAGTANVASKAANSNVKRLIGM